MIYVSQGHENSISLEIFLKSFIMLSHKERQKFILVVDKENFDYQIRQLRLNSILSSLECLFIEGQEPLSTLSLKKCLEKTTEKDILITLPTSKDQLLFEGNPTTGHTDFFRRHFKNKFIVMTFSCRKDLILLMSDHIPLLNVAEEITEELIFAKTKIVLQEWKKYFYPIAEVFFSGINPHAGENGLLGKDDVRITDAIKRLGKDSSVRFSGPFSADSLSMKKREKNSMLVYMYHDQGLCFFKERHGLLGLNITLGLPFLRFSVDHGTAFDLYGKNNAYYLGCFQLLKEALKIQRKTHGNR